MQVTFDPTNPVERRLVKAQIADLERQESEQQGDPEYEEAIRQLLQTESGKGLIEAAIRHFPHSRFTLAQLATQMGKDHITIQSWHRHTGRNALIQKLGARVFENHGGYPNQLSVPAKLKKAVEKIGAEQESLE
ncbi:MAG: hypothetical protein ACLP9L_08120 [Thermoguttaceae bacterium]